MCLFLSQRFWKPECRKTNKQINKQTKDNVILVFALRFWVRKQTKKEDLGRSNGSLLLEGPSFADFIQLVGENWPQTLLINSSPFWEKEMVRTNKGKKERNREGEREGGEPFKEEEEEEKDRERRPAPALEMPNRRAMTIGENEKETTNFNGSVKVVRISF